MMKQRLFFACALAVAVLAPVASARTVSVWPIEDAEDFLYRARQGMLFLFR